MTKKLNLLGFAAAATLTFGLTSCDKADLNDVTSVSDPVVEDAKAHSLVINALANQNLSDLDLQINGKNVALDLDYSDITEYFDIDAGELALDVIAQDGSILASSSYTFEKGQLYNIAIVLDKDGVTPTIQVLDMDPGNYKMSDEIEANLALSSDLGNVFAVNVVDYTIGTENYNLVLDLGYANDGLTTIDGLLNLDYGVVSGVFFGTETILSDIGLSSVDVDLEGIIEELTDKDDVLIDLGDVFGLKDFASISELNNALDVVFDAIVNADLFAPGHDYTLLLVGTLEDLDLVIVDQTLAGITEIME